LFQVAFRGLQFSQCFGLQPFFGGPRLGVLLTLVDNFLDMRADFKMTNSDHARAGQNRKNQTNPQ